MPRDSDILGVASYSDLTDPPEPVADDAHCGRRVLVEVLRMSVDCTEKEITDAKYGDAPEGYDYLLAATTPSGACWRLAKTCEVSDPATTW